MKFYSTVTKKIYDTVEDLNAAEAEILNKENRRAADKKAVDEALEARNAADKKYRELLRDYCNKYGYYSYTDPESAREEFNIFADAAVREMLHGSQL